jgi:uncharacterized membrane protein YkoI
MKRWSVVLFLAGTLAFAVGPLPAGTSHDDAKLLQEKGVIVPLERIVEDALRLHRGHVVETELERKKGKYVYEVEIVDEQGVLWELKYDAANGTLIKAKEATEDH